MSGAVDTAQDARLRVMASRIIAQQRWPYVSAVLFALRLVRLPAEQMPTMAVDDGWRMYYSDEFVLEQEPEQLATVLLHEAMHCLNQHGKRFAALSQPTHLHPVWNYAGDAAINETLDEAQMPWPSVEPVRYASLAEYGVTPGMATETAYFAILDALDSDETLPGSDCGSIVGGEARGYELPADHKINPRIRNEQQDSVRDRVAHDIVEHSKYRGDVPAGLLRWAESVLHPRVNWREALASKIRRDLSMVAGRRDYTYARPSRRQEAMRLIGSSVLLPAMRQPAPPRVAAVVDTSGSITDRELREFAAELIGITRASGVASGVAVLPCDVQVYDIQRIRSRGDVEKLTFSGGGGTDMSAGVAAAADLHPRPHIIVVFTDGETPWPDEQPSGVDSVIVVLSQPSAINQVPQWCSTITMEDV
jgi:predicted metal-dependent peptidase